MSAQCGHIDLVDKFLYTSGITIDGYREARYAAASMGHLNIFKLMGKIPLKYNVDEFKTAAEGNHLDVVKYLHKILHLHDDDIIDTLHFSASKGSFDVSLYLYDQVRDYSRVSYKQLIHSSLYFNELYFLRHITRDIRSHTLLFTSALIGAVAHGNLDMAEHFLEMGSTVTTSLLQRDTGKRMSRLLRRYSRN